MKTLVSKLVKSSVAGLLLMMAVQANSQAIVPPVKQASDLYVGGDYTKGTSTNDGKTLFCAENAVFQLKADPQDPVTHTNYASFSWEEQQTGTANFGAVAGAVSGTSSADLSISGATPGWHVYKVTATLTGNSCPPEPSYFTVYVLPKLKVSAESNKATATEHTYCESGGAPTGSNAIKFSGTVVFDGTPNALPGLQALTVDDFEVQYTWNKINGSTVTQVGTSKDYEVNDAASSALTATTQYTYELTAVYTVKACGTYKGAATLNGSTTTATVTVTPKPGKPVITIQ